MYRPLPELAAEILDAHNAYTAGQQSALEHVKRAGDRLNEAREQVPPGRWFAWLDANRPEISRRTAQGYMRVAREWSRLVELAGGETRVSRLPYREALAMLVDEETEPNELGTGGNDDVSDDAGDGDGPDPDNYPQRFQICLDGRTMRAFRAHVAGLKSDLHTSNNTDTVVKGIASVRPLLNEVARLRDENARLRAALNEPEDDDANDTVDRCGWDARL